MGNKKFNYILGIAATMLLAGCGPKSAAPTAASVNQRAFDQAPAEVVQLWQTALAAEKINDYETAESALTKLSGAALTPEQANAYNAEKQSFDQKLTEAAAKNDPVALKAIEEMRNSHPRRR